MKQTSPVAADVSELTYRAFIRAYGFFRNVMEPFFLQFGISGAHWGVLRTLHRARGEGINGLQLNELARRLLIRPPSITSLVDRLERMSLVSRSVAAKDHRAKLVTLTRRGEKLIDRVLEQHPAKVHAVLAGLNSQQQREFYDLIQLFSTHMEGLVNNKPVPEADEFNRESFASPPMFGR